MALLNTIVLFLASLGALAVSESDGVASDILLRLLGGPHVVDAYVPAEHCRIAYC